MSFREMVAVCFENKTKHIKENVDGLKNIRILSAYSYHFAL